MKSSNVTNEVVLCHLGELAVCKLNRWIVLEA